MISTTERQIYELVAGTSSEKNTSVLFLSLGRDCSTSERAPLTLDVLFVTAGKIYLKRPSRQLMARHHRSTTDPRLQREALPPHRSVVLSRFFSRLCISFTFGPVPPACPHCQLAVTPAQVIKVTPGSNFLPFLPNVIHVSNNSGLFFFVLKRQTTP